ncbi:MAG: M48 family metalloprotease [Armatimonadetes bacterium]|nr:M48 family metalloprotease [Armatimonadota bacterium]
MSSADKLGYNWVPSYKRGSPEAFLIIVDPDFPHSDVYVLLKSDQLRVAAEACKTFLTNPDAYGATIYRGRKRSWVRFQFKNKQIDLFNSECRIPDPFIPSILANWNLPKRGALGVNANRLNTTVTVGPTTYTKIDFVPLPKKGELLPITTRTARHWYGIVGGIACSGFIVFAFLIFFRILFGNTHRPWRKQKKAIANTVQEAHRRFIKTCPLAVAAIILIPLVGVGVVLTVIEGLQDLTLWAPVVTDASIVLLTVPLVLVPAARLVIRLSNNIEREQAQKASARQFLLTFLPLLICEANFVGLQRYPGIYLIVPRPILLAWAIFWLIATVVMPALAAISTIKSRRRLFNPPTVLKAGDAFYDATMEAAKRMDVVINKVALLESLQQANAFARIGGVVGASKRLLDELSPSEQQFIAAHEVAHLQLQNPKTLQKHVLVFVSVFVPTAIVALFVRDLTPWPLLVLSCPVVLLLISIIGSAPWYRRQELLADARALKVTMNFEAAVTALAKITTLSGQPYDLPKAFLILATHPSLKTRIEALYEEAVKLNLNPSPTLATEILTRPLFTEPEVGPA